ncbi:hypothetical protein VTN77DRAFT_3006 [Rasamsonia byssochlamydoides]|uniref:uncharacterized protein n=1 Tax=Rasamsonia byssochlamydoides TaxID=89139 RepID=UPI0037431FA4
MEGGGGSLNTDGLWLWVVATPSSPHARCMNRVSSNAFPAAAAVPARLLVAYSLSTHPPRPTLGGERAASSSNYSPLAPGSTWRAIQYNLSLVRLPSVSQSGVSAAFQVTVGVYLRLPEGALALDRALPWGNNQRGSRL